MKHYSWQTNGSAGGKIAQTSKANIRESNRRSSAPDARAGILKVKVISGGTPRETKKKKKQQFQVKA